MPTLATDAGGGLRDDGRDRLPRLDDDRRAASRDGAGRLVARVAPDARSSAADVVHYPLTVPVPPADRPTVLTLLDVQHLDLPQLFPRGERLFRRLAYDRAAARADQVIVISDWVRGARDRAARPRPGPRPRDPPRGRPRARSRPSETVEREPFLYYPARPWPHKNHARLFEAFERAAARPAPSCGSCSPERATTPRRLPEGVEALGDAPLATRVDLYRRAAAVVFPSLYEGFGLPPLEAMACGCPVAALDRRLAAGGRRRRRRALRPGRSRRDRGRASSERSSGAPTSARSGSSARRASPGTRRRAPTTRLRARRQLLTRRARSASTSIATSSSKLTSGAQPSASRAFEASPTRSCSSAAPRGTAQGRCGRARASRGPPRRTRTRRAPRRCG